MNVDLYDCIVMYNYIHTLQHRTTKWPGRSLRSEGTREPGPGGDRQAGGRSVDGDDGSVGRSHWPVVGLDSSGGLRYCVLDMGP